MISIVGSLCERSAHIKIGQLGIAFSMIIAFQPGKKKKALRERCLLLSLVL